MSEKRAHSPDAEEVPPSSGAVVLSTKKQKTGSEIVIGTVTKEGIKRTSNLQAPIMQLIGHGAEIFSLKFAPDGQTMASGSFDKLIFLWKTYGDCPNYMMLKVGIVTALMHPPCMPPCMRMTVPMACSHACRVTRMQYWRCNGRAMAKEYCPVRPTRRCGTSCVGSCMWSRP